MDSGSQQQNNNNWRIQDIWNELLTEDRPVKPRNYIRGSEIGKPLLDRYLAMKGVQPTNPFTPRIKRVFDCGFIFEVEIVERMFRLLGILQAAQGEVRLKRDGFLEVVGHFDHKVGGKINPDQVREALEDPHISPWMKVRVAKLLKHLYERYPDGLKTIVADVKTVNSQAFWSHKNQDEETGFFKGYDNHKLQLFTYMLALMENEGRLFYISKDDLTLFETPIYLHDKKLLTLWEDDIAAMTYHYLADKKPEREEDIVWNEDKKLYEINWRVARSNYFTLITGYPTVKDWQEKIAYEVKKLNIAKCMQCDKPFSLMTLNKNDGICGRCMKSKKPSTTLNNDAGQVPVIATL